MVEVRSNSGTAAKIWCQARLRLPRLPHDCAAKVATFIPPTGSRFSRDPAGGIQACNVCGTRRGGGKERGPCAATVGVEVSL